MRAWVRALFGVSNTLRKLGRPALEVYEVLRSHQADMNSGGSFVNFHTHLPELWLRVHGPAKTLELALRCGGRWADAVAEAGG